jgi:hypothetical protein
LAPLTTPADTLAAIDVDDIQAEAAAAEPPRRTRDVLAPALVVPTMVTLVAPVAAKLVGDSEVTALSSNVTCTSIVAYESSATEAAIGPTVPGCPSEDLDRRAVDDTHMVVSAALTPIRLPRVVALLAKTPPTIVTLMAPVLATLWCTA